MIDRPVSVEPVKATLSTSGCATSAAPTARPPVTTLTTPGGTPASTAIRASNKALSEVSSAGFNTAVQPAARHTASFALAKEKGEFQGMINAATPTGSRRV